jgi:hypothetical protein
MTSFNVGSFSLDNEIKKIEMSGVCETYGGESKYIQRFGGGT